MSCTHRHGLLQLPDFFFLNDTATTAIYTLSLHDALPISCQHVEPGPGDLDAPLDVDGAQHLAQFHVVAGLETLGTEVAGDRKSTRLNSSHVRISYAVFCLKKKKSRSTSLTSIPSSPRLSY